MQRRNFIKTIGFALAAPTIANAMVKPWFDISLAEWSVHKAIFDGQLDNLDFPAKAKNDFGINIVEYVNTCFKSKDKSFKENGADDNYLKELLKRCKDHGVKNHLIMCDAEGNLADQDTKKRDEAVENHKKWINAAAYLGCKTIRVNAAGGGTNEEHAKQAVEGLSKLGEIAAKSKINVIVENHGGITSNGEWLSGVLRTINMKNVGALPDFGNFCMERDKDNWRKCLSEYDRYKGVEELLPFAKGISAKTNGFKPDGQEIEIDYKRMLDMVKKSGFRGIIGIEYEGEDMTEDNGIKATQKLLEKYRYS